MYLVNPEAPRNGQVRQFQSRGYRESPGRVYARHTVLGSYSGNWSIIMCIVLDGSGHS